MTTELSPPPRLLATTETTPSSRCFAARLSFWALFPQKRQNCPSRPQSSESSKCHVILSCVNAAGCVNAQWASQSQRHRLPSPAPTIALPGQRRQSRHCT